MLNFWIFYILLKREYFLLFTEKGIQFEMRYVLSFKFSKRESKFNRSCSMYYRNSLIIEILRDTAQDFYVDINFTSTIFIFNQSYSLYLICMLILRCVNICLDKGNTSRIRVCPKYNTLRLFRKLNYHTHTHTYTYMYTYKYIFFSWIL